VLTFLIAYKSRLLLVHNYTIFCFIHVHCTLHWPKLLYIQLRCRSASKHVVMLCFIKMYNFGCMLLNHSVVFIIKETKDVFNQHFSDYKMTTFVELKHEKYGNITNEYVIDV